MILARNIYIHKETEKPFLIDEIGNYVDAKIQGFVPGVMYTKEAIVAHDEEIAKIAAQKAWDAKEEVHDGTDVELYETFEEYWEKRNG